MIVKKRRNRTKCLYYKLGSDKFWRTGFIMSGTCKKVGTYCASEYGDDHVLGTYCCGVSCGMYKEKQQ